ncbi:tetratricopeptide repeat-containing sensor histidine kinase [Winogradskyella bathintestinalis]|uniref:histidine kinase n=1 Tax=Winogradskyella bathintestinalis TaxID=3035208 RepID=A0ABT7ZV86_9FLAO|nr:tetratricopeptide repeat protein [Winogradskyella bathintestinalis]MDN3492920.1 tetratricopeptide repeat protein [Winogradskyella bathintestinalis]
MINYKPSIVVLLIIVLFGINKEASSQNTSNSVIDSLTTTLERETNIEKKLEILSKLVDEAFQNDLNLAKTFAVKGANLAEQSQHRTWQPKFYEMQGRMHANLLDLDSASLNFDKALKGYTAINDKKGQATTYFKIGWVHKRKGQIEDALTVDLKALKLMESIDDKLGIAGAYNRISEDLSNQGKYKEAYAYALKTIELCKQNNLETELAYAYTAAGDTQIAMGNNEASFEYYDAALDLAKSLNFSIFDIINFSNNRANALKRKGDYKEAKVAYEEAMTKAKAVDYDNAIYVITANLGEINLLLDNYTEALTYQLQTVATQENHGDVSNLTENYHHLSTIYEKLNNYPKALEYQKKTLEMRDSVAKIESDKTMSQLMTQFETEKKDKTIEAQHTQIAQQRKTQLLYIAIAAILAFSLIDMFFSAKNIRKKRQALQVLNTKLDTKNKQNELLLKEIHHRVKNNLEMVKSLIALQSAHLEDSATKDAMIASQNRVQSMGIIHQKLYQGTNLGAIEMKDYFLNLSDGILDAFNAEDKIKIECAMDELELDLDTAVPIGLIVNELLTNALKYAFPKNDSGKISIQLAQKTNDILHLEVADNGVGKVFGITPKGTGFGTQLVQLLTQQLNGTMEEHNLKGTIISFEFKHQKAA